MRFIVTMGIPDPQYNKKSEGFCYNGAVLQRIDWGARKIVEEIKYTSPPENLGPGLSMMFKGGLVCDDKLYVVTNTEVLRYDRASLRLETVVTHPTFNDLHAVYVQNGAVYVCNTGLEIVQLLGRDGKPEQTWNLASVPTWRRFDAAMDYRTVATTKPHECHINHLFELDGEMWVTLGGQRKARSLADAGRSIDMDPFFGDDEKVLCHDGLVCGGHIFFTSVNGSLLVVDRHTLKVEERLRLTTKESLGGKVGWTRGIEVVGGKAYVGMTKARHSKFKEYTKWLLTGEHGTLPSSIVEVDLSDGGVTDIYQIEGYQGSAIYSIIKE